MTAAIEPDASRAEMLRATLTGASMVGSLDDLGTHLAAHPGETVVVVGSSVPMEDATAFAQAQRVVRPAVGVVLLRERIDSALLASALRSGIREVIADRDPAELAEAVLRTRALGEEMLGGTVGPTGDSEGNGRLVTVFSTKGGVGKTTIATNLAVALAADQRVCIVDLDVMGGDVAVMLKLFPASTLANLRDLRGAITPESVGSLVTDHESGAAVIAAPVGADAREPVSAEEVGQLLGCLKSMYDVVVVDTSGSFDDYALHAFDVSDLLVLVATLDIPALKNLKEATGTLDLLNLDRSRWRLVVNRADDKVGLSVAEFQDTIGFDIAARLPSSRDVLTCVNKGESIVAAMPRHKLSKAVRGLAEEVVPAIGVPAGPDTGRSSERRGRRRKERVAE